MGQMRQIGLGGGVTVGINEENTLVLTVESDDGIYIEIPFSYGIATKGRIDFMIECLEKLKEELPE